MEIKEEKVINDWLKEWHGKHEPMPAPPVVAQDRPIPNQYLTQICDLMEKYTTLQCECKRFADYVMNLTHNRDTQALQFDDEYLNMAGNMLFEAFGRIPNLDHEEIIKELKK